MFLNGFAAMAYFYLHKPLFLVSSPPDFIAFVIIIHAAIFAQRYFVARFLLPKIAVTDVAFGGRGRAIKELRKTLRRLPRLGFRIAVFAPPGPLKEEEKHVSGYLDGIDILVVDSDNLKQYSKLAGDLIEEARFKQVELLTHTEFYEQIHHKILPSQYSNYTWVINNLQNFSRSVFTIVYPIVNIFIGSLLLLVSLPFLGLAALLVKLSGEGPVLTRQQRMGFMEKQFTVYNFRTTSAGAPWVPPFSPPGVKDAMLTKTGAWLKKLRIEDMPMLINIVKGDLFFVGPAPHRVDEVRILERANPSYKFRHFVKPGLSGITGLKPADPHTQQELMEELDGDLFYVKNKSFGLDVYILTKTFLRIFKKPHAGAETAEAGNNKDA